jgi:hypothetical protein
MRAVLVAVAFVCLIAGPARAGSVGFGGTVLDSCSLSLSNAGTLAMALDGTVMGSEEAGGQPAHLTILSTGSHTVTVGAPTLVSSPAGYATASQSLEVAYQGQSLLSGVSQAYTTSDTSFSVATIALSILEINNRIRNPGGFAAGSYATQTVVTCN